MSQEEQYAEIVDELKRLRETVEGTRKKPRYLRFDEVQRRTGLCRTTVWKYERKDPPDFPRRVVLGPRMVGWLETEVDAWIERRAATNRATPAA
jgi:prophage regulatory protein